MAQNSLKSLLPHRGKRSVSSLGVHMLWGRCLGYCSLFLTQSLSYYLVEFRSTSAWPTLNSFWSWKASCVISLGRSIHKWKTKCSATVNQSSSFEVSGVTPSQPSGRQDLIKEYEVLLQFCFQEVPQRCSIRESLSPPALQSYTLTAVWSWVKVYAYVTRRASLTP